MKCVVTGGAGFIGSHIVDELVRRGEEVAVVDNLVTGNMDNLKQAQASDRIRFVKGDIKDLRLLKKEFKKTDFVFHHAALISVVESMDKPEEYELNNVQGTRNVLEAARINGVKRVMFSSSGAVYGHQPIPFTEQTPTELLSNYAKNKFEGEKLCKEYYDKYGFKTIVFRYANAFGPRQDPKSDYAGVISIFIKKLLRGEIPNIYGDGEQTRDFVYVKNIVEANMLACKSESGFGEPINIGSGKETSVNELYMTISKILGNKAKPNYEPARGGEARKALFDISKAERVLGFKCKYDLMTGTRDTVEWFRQKKE